MMRAIDFPKNHKNIKDGNINVCQRCKDCFEESEKVLKEILGLDTKYKLILGGPGTGKTFLFAKVIKGLPQNTNILVITFINNLVDDLEKQLSDILDHKIKIRTLHGFCKNFLLREIHQYEYFPELPKIIAHDASLLGFDFKERQFSQAFINLKENNKDMRFYLSRSNYYDSASHDDAVYRVFSHLTKNDKQIPQYSHVIVDEYQDFNLLESSLIKLLAYKNKIIIAGDDDQGLYRFKSASPEFIRALYRNHEFKSLFLPFCRRCTSVLVQAANCFISNAKKRGLLSNRIDKQFKCYWPDKFLDSKRYPLIFLKKFYAHSVVSKYIKKRILSIVKEEKIEPTEKHEAEFLIVGPPRISHYLQDVNESLIKDEELDQNIFEIEFKKEPTKISISDGYEFIRRDEKSNLGWRIVMFIDPIDSSLEKDRNLIRKSLKGNSLINFLPGEYIKKHRDKINRISLDKTTPQEDSSNKKIKIKLTTYLGAKGLSANHVFVLGLENDVFPENPHSISDDEACQFIVLLTRARRSLSLLSVKSRFDVKLRRPVDKLSSFISMIPNRLLKQEDIKASDLEKLKV